MVPGEDREAQAIASSWGIDVKLLEGLEWTLETIDGNDGELYGFHVHFDENTDQNILAAIGVAPGEFTRQLSLNAFDEPDVEDSNERRRARQSRVRGTAFAGDAFAGHAFLTEDRAAELETAANELQDGWLPLGEAFARVPLFNKDVILSEPVPLPKAYGRAYYTEQERLTPLEFRTLEPHEQVDAMVQWFHENFEDPAVRTPYESAEGGYQWIWGGPYDALDQLTGEFHDIVDEVAIEEAAAKITKDGLYEWAPKARREDYDQVVDLNAAGEDEDFNEPGAAEDWNERADIEDYSNTARRRTEPSPEGEANPTEESIALRGPSNLSGFSGESVSSVTRRGAPPRDFQKELLARVESLEDALQTYKGNLPPRSHNHPPELVEPDPLSPDEVRVVEAVTAEMRKETNLPQPDPVKLASHASKLKAAANSILAWIGRKLDLGVDTAIKTTIPLISAGTVWKFAAPENVYAKLVELAEIATAWAHHLTNF